MKSTGVIRRIDELGRIVIPKEIRKTLRIHDGDSLEIFTDNNDNIILSKYSSISVLNELANNIVQAINKVINGEILITDNDKVIAVSNNLKSKFINNEISLELLNYIKRRELYKSDEQLNLKITENEELNGYFLISPIIVNSDSLGLIIIYSEDKITELDYKIIQFITCFFIKYLDE